MKQFLLLVALLFSTAYSYSQPSWHSVKRFDNVGGSQYGAIDALGTDFAYVVMNNGIFFKSLDGGTSWTQHNVSVSEVFFDLKFVDTTTGFTVGTNGTILKTTDGGQTWASLSSTTSEDLFSIEIISLNNIWVVGNNGTVLHSTDAGVTWNLDNSLSTEMLNSVQFRNANEGYIAGNNGTLLYTSDGGATWQGISIGIAEDLFSLSVTQNNTQLLAGNVDENYYHFASSTAFKTTDGTNWTNYPLMGLGGVGISCLYFQNDMRGFHISAAAALCNCSDLRINRTTDAGQNWNVCYMAGTEDSNYPFLGGYSDMVFVNNNTGYAFVRNYVFKTTNGGDWTNSPPQEFFSVEEFNTSNFSIYPNPSRGDQIKIAFNNVPLTAYSVEIVDLRGKQVFYAEKVNGNSINISGLGSGMYFLNILKKGKTIGSEKLIKSN